MKSKKFTETIELNGVTAKYENRIMTVSGKAGTVSRRIYLPELDITLDSSNITVVCNKAGQREKMHFGTTVAHIKNLVKGAAEGFTCKLKVCSGHFPMTVAVTGKKIEVKNFLGEKIPRVLVIKDGAKVTLDGNDITVTSPDKELTGVIASDIEILMRVPNKDRRIFQDGIYITDKNGRQQ